eukprot:GHVT01099855.1.p1 GENE.GHVT01099855.1~~GHVT01099855.1.p1  ORF type:complete len:153 (-),score=2.25 GHVT01099855.1:499-957(-)
MASARSRILSEVREAHRSPDPDIELQPTEDNLYNWTAYIHGPADSPYEGGRWKLRIICPSDYPISPPSVTFLTLCFHPNVSFKTGELCLDVLKASWSPAWTLQYLCRAVIAVLADPNAESPLNCDAGNLIRSGDMRGFRSVARMYTAELAMP